MAENLRTTRYADGTSLVNNQSSWANDYTTKQYSLYPGQDVNKVGLLYSWAAAMNGAGNGGVQGLKQQNHKQNRKTRVLLKACVFLFY
jgi:hypothetical protein